MNFYVNETETCKIHAFPWYLAYGMFKKFIFLGNLSKQHKLKIIDINGEWETQFGFTIDFPVLLGRDDDYS